MTSADDEPAGSCEMITLPNGLRAVRERASGEVMHPGAGPRAEAESVYVLASRLEQRLAEGGDPLVLFDVGLGAATNAITAWRASEALAAGARRLEIVSFERELDALKLALHPDNAEAMGLTGEAHAAASALLANGHYETPRTSWRLRLGDFREWLSGWPAGSVDVVYWDMFSPKSAPELWTAAMFAAVRRVCREGATLHTYSASTSTRSGLLLGGFAVGVGPRTGERAETTVAATRVADLEGPLDAKWLGRLARSSVAYPKDVPRERWAEALEKVRASAQFRGAE